MIPVPGNHTDGIAYIMKTAPHHYRILSDITKRIYRLMNADATMTLCHGSRDVGAGQSFSALRQKRKDCLVSSIELRHVKKSYEGKPPVIPDLSLEIPDGSFTVLVGPSGCGKSTTLRMIAGLEDVTAGDILIDGARVNEVSPSERDIAMVFQNYALYPTMSVQEKSNSASST